MRAAVEDPSLNKPVGTKLGPSATVEAIAAAIAAVIASAVAAWVLRLWEWRPGLPLSLEGDSPFVAMQLRDIYDHGWYWSNPDLAYPYGQGGSLFPELNVIHVAVVKVVGLVAQDAYTSGVVYFVLGFPLAAATAYLLGRSQGVAPVPAVVLGVLFAVAPGHQEQFEHLWLAAYWTVPLAIWVILEVAKGRPLITKRRERGGWRARATSRTLATTASLVAVGLSGVYYVAFTLILLLTVALGRRWATGEPRSWLPGVGAAAVIVAVILVPLSMARSASDGQEIVGSPPATRSFIESELYAGKLMDLVLPWSGHRVDALAALNFAYNSGPRPTVEVAALGIIGTVGMLALAVLALRQILTGVAPALHLRLWAALAAVSFAFYTVGGLGSLAAMFATPQVRTWSRISVFILVFGLLAVVSWLTKLGRSRGQAPAVAMSVVLLVVGVLDQTNPDRAPAHAEVSSRWMGVSAYAEMIKDQTSPECGVFQLPVFTFPEGSRAGGVGPYDQLLPYLASSGLRWSSGAMRGTASGAWQTAVDPIEVQAFAEALAAAGFCALEVDNRAFPQGADLHASLEPELGPPIAETADGDVVAYRLPVATGDIHRARQRLLEPVIVSLDSYEIRLSATGGRQWVGPRATLRLVNLGEATVPVDITIKVRSHGSDRQLRVGGGQAPELLRAEITPTSTRSLRLRILVEPGVTRLPVTLTEDPDRLLDPRIWVSAEVTDIAATSTAEVRVASLMRQVTAGLVIQ